MADVELIGNDEWESPAGTNAGDYFYLFRHPAVQSGTVTAIQVTMLAAVGVIVAIYADADGEPGSLIGASTKTVAETGINQIPISSPATIEAGEYYWLASNGQSNGIRRSFSASVRRYKPVAYSTFAFPDPAGSGFSSSTTYLSAISGWGTLASGGAGRLIGGKSRHIGGPSPLIGGPSPLIG